MQWKEVGIILHVRPFSENARIVTFFNKSLGKTSAILKNTKLTIQAGDVCDLFWKGKSAEQLGTVKSEIIFSPFCHSFQEPIKIFAIDSACAMCMNGLYFSAPHEKLFIALMNLLLSINKDDWIERYVFFEMSLLSEVGYGLDLSKCAVTGVKEGLCYVSPKTGCAVTEEVGLAYKDKLFVLPQFMVSEMVHENKKTTKYDIFCALNITEHFLKAYFYGINKKELPLSRRFLADSVAGHHDSAA